MDIFLYAPHDFRNLCVIARSLECFGITRSYVFDPCHLVRHRYGKSYRRRIQTVSAGAFFMIQWVVIDDPLKFLNHYDGRFVATLPAQSAASLFGFSFLPSDLIIFGSEGNGIPTEIQGLCDCALAIPCAGQTQSLNLSVAVSIVLAEMQRYSLDTSQHSGVT
jgi:tRNA (cytidine/uridine-2'-O-)-methyltransferase